MKYRCSTSFTLGEKTYEVGEEISQETWDGLSEENQANFELIEVESETTEG